MSYLSFAESCVIVCTLLSELGVHGNRDYDPRPEYCGLARNTYDSLYFVPFFLGGLPEMAPTDFSGKWKLVRSENFDEYLKEMNLAYLARKIATHITPIHEIEQNGESFVIRISTPRGTQVMTFTIGEEFVQTVMSYQGDFVCKATWDGNQLVIEYTPKDPEKKPVKETREIIDDEYVLTIYIGEVVCKRIFQRKT